MTRRSGPRALMGLQPASCNTIANMIEYSLNTGSLSSGTYFATLVLNGTEVGDGQFVVTK